MTSRSLATAALLVGLVAQACSTAATSSRPSSRPSGRVSDEARGWAFKGENDGFVVATLLTDDFPALIGEWQQTGSPRLEAVGVAKLGGSLNVAFLVTGCRPGKDGRCDVAAEVTITNAAGEVRAKARIDDLCPDQESPPPGRYVLCGRTPAVDNNGRPEKLRIGARVIDVNSGRSVDVKLVAEFR